MLPAPIRDAPARHGFLLLVAVLCIAGPAPAREAAALPPPGHATGSLPPITLQVAADTDESGARVTLTFSRQVEYRLEESSSRLSLVFEEPLDDRSKIERRVEGGVLRRIRAGSRGRGSEVIFYLGRGFDTFSSTEMTGPFRVVLQFQRKGASRLEPAVPAVTGGEPGPAEAPPVGGKPAGEAASPPERGEPPVPEPPAPQPHGGARVIALDPGHGGDEEGAVGAGGLKEKELALDIAVRLRTLLQRSGHTVLLTREGDSTLDLTRRTAIANHAGAALLLSIHANASARSAARGAETYFLSYGEVADQEAMSVAGQENLPAGAAAGSGAEGDEGGIRMVLWEMAQAEHLGASSRLADLIQIEMNALGETKDRGVKQAPFRVLVGADMPAVLVEVGFLSNPEEEKKLASSEYRDQIAGALAAAISKFEQERGRQEGASSLSPDGKPR